MASGGPLLVDYFKRDGMSGTDASRRISMFSAAWQAPRQRSLYSGQLGGKFVLHGWILPGGGILHVPWSIGYVDPKATRPPVLLLTMVEMKIAKQSRPRKTATGGWNLAGDDDWVESVKDEDSETTKREREKWRQRGREAVRQRGQPTEPRQPGSVSVQVETKLK